MESSIKLWQLSERLKTIASFIPDHKRVADIGGDHALLLTLVAKENRLQKGIVGEINRGPHQNASERVKLADLTNLIDVRLGDGLAVIQPGEVEVVVIAGMGGALIASILEQGKDKLAGVERLILQPNIGESRVRCWLEENGFRLVEETIVEEAGIYYEILVAEPGKPGYAADQILGRDMAREVGPLLWERRHPLLHKKLQEVVAGKRKILRQLNLGKTEQAIARKRELEKEIETWERVIQCLSKENN
ncbi:tRNA (adenine(22)-N(1))-methyltransferase [Laceyella sacchari]|uniref:Class I SAM-dependent methyltransferase n=1 Tax=Laceyella sacchari TaxID=37482 RepID=A0ABY5U042_LACSH|nr:class I SAM-dependent methyltransferase [Laceyella sacchari]UWE02813.1 class I SAM-dependent methyltransferase [Laceyella sacchari]